MKAFEKLADLSSMTTWSKEEGNLEVLRVSDILFYFCVKC